MPTRETKRLEIGSIYAMTKRDHEEMCLVVGRAYGMRTLALRFFNVYGPRQSMSNPYTGVAAIFASRLLAGARPTIFEDGLQSRDFVHVSDVAAAVELALYDPLADGQALNVGTGVPTTVLDIARTLAAGLGVEIAPEVVNRFRHGDVRHCFADITRISSMLGYAPRVSIADGLRELATWIRESGAESRDGTARATAELEQHGLVQ